jgi:hypothetical protein
MSPFDMDIICPVCQNAHNNRYSDDSDWCTECAQAFLEDQANENT